MKGYVSAGFLVGAVLAWTGFAAANEEEPGTVPHFQEVLRLLRGNLPGVTEAELNESIVRGLTTAFGDRVVWVTGPAPEPAAHESGLRRTAIYEKRFGYLGVKEIVESLGDDVTQAMHQLRDSTNLVGWVLDLRFANGTDYHAAATAADLFVEPGNPLVRIDEQVWTSTESGEPPLPVVVLVNARTTGAAEALAGALQNVGPAVVLGSRTAGRVLAMRSFDLAQGGQLLIAGAPVKVGDGVELNDGVTPDLRVDLSLNDDEQWIEDPYFVPKGSEQLASLPAARINEAALVAHHRGETNLPSAGQPAVTSEDEEAEGVLRDPALVRAIALLKGVNRLRGGILR